MQHEPFGDMSRFLMPIEMGHPQQGKGKATSLRSPRITGEFLRGPIPLAWLSRAAECPGRAPLAVAIAIWFESGRKRQAITIVLTSAICKRLNVTRKSKYRGLVELEKAGLIECVREPRRNPVVTVLVDMPSKPVDDGPT